MTGLDDRRHLRHIQAAVRAIERTAMPAGREAWMTDPLLRDATNYRLQTMCESAQRLSPGVKGRHPEIPRRQIGAMRNRLVHGYHTIDPAIVWSVVEHDVRPLGRVAGRELARRPGPEAGRQAAPGTKDHAERQPTPGRTGGVDLGL